MLDTSNSNNYEYTTKHLELHILGGLKTNKLESLRITISVQKPNQHNILRHSIDLYNDNQVEKFVRKVAERLEIGTSVVRRTLQEVTKELENYRFLLIQQYEEAHKPFFKELSVTEEREATITVNKNELCATDALLIYTTNLIESFSNIVSEFL